MVRFFFDPIEGWRFLLVPAAIALFGLRFGRGGLPRQRLVYGAAAIALWCSCEVVRIIRGFPTRVDRDVVLFALCMGAIPTIAAGIGGLIVGRWIRINVWVASVLVLGLAYLSLVVGARAAFNFIDLVQAVG